MSIRTDEIRSRIKGCIASVTSLNPSEIADDASYADDLALDSLSILETVVEVEYQFGIKVPEKEMEDIRTVEDTVRLVQMYLCGEAA